MKFKNGDKIVFAGDSITDANKLNTNDRLGEGYVRLIRDALTAFEPQDRYTIVNAGISGNTSRDLLARWEQDVTALRPDVVFCMIGINDVWRHFDGLAEPDALVSEEEYEKNLREICKKAKGFRQFYLITPYFMERNRQDEMRMLTEKYASVMRRVAEENGVGLLDAQAVFDEYMVARPGQSIMWDRVHPGTVGSMLLARMILRG